jgi:hypothetical protein
MATSATTVIAAMVAKARREVREHFDQRNAFDPNHAAAYDPPDSMHRRQFDHLVGRSILRSTGDGRYWIDREAEKIEEERRRAAAILVLKIILAAVALVIAGAAIMSAAR